MLELLLLLISLYLINITTCFSEIEIDADSSSLKLSKGSNIGLYSDAYVRDVYRSGVRRASRDAKTDECKNLIEYEHMENVKTILNVDQPWLFEDKLFFSQCAETVAKHPPLVRYLLYFILL
jgi:hypothetical protein